MIDKEQIQKLTKKYKKDPEILEVLMEIARERLWFDICPEISLRKLNKILDVNETDWLVISNEQTGSHAGSMAYEFYHDIIIKKDYNKQLWGIKYSGIEIDGDEWDDYIANEGDDIIFNVIEVELVTEVKKVYKFNND